MPGTGDEPGPPAPLPLDPPLALALPEAPPAAEVALAPPPPGLAEEPALPAPVPGAVEEPFPSVLLLHASTHVTTAPLATRRANLI
jgi:hypothetical protein